MSAARTFTAIVVDDEELARGLLREHLADHPEVEVVAECANGPEAVRAVGEHRPDLLFLDVQMPGLDGFETLELLDPVPAVVFVTAYDRYALRAFEVHAVDYLLKPYSRERFDTAVARAEARAAGGERLAAGAVSAVAASARGPGTFATRLAFRERDGVAVVPVRAVDYVKAEDDYVLVVAGERRHLRHEPLAALEARLDPARFVRVHRSWIVALDRLVRVEEGRWAVLASGERLPVSRTGAARLRERMAR